MQPRTGWRVNGRSVEHPGRAVCVLAAAAVIAAGCSHVATVPSGKQQLADEQLDEETIEEVELDPAITKLDEADIGVSGPEQIEDAIETLDAQTESSPPLVSGIGGTVAAPSAGDLFERMRAGFVLDDVDHATVEREVRWFASHPTYLDRTFKRGERYLYHIVNEIEARKMPLELALLPVVESAFNPVAYSRARASGLWQFIPGTGRRYDLKQNWYYDGRRDVIAATSAALDYLEFLSEEFDGDWLLAVAAYNCGEANIARAVKRNRAAGKPTDFFSLKLPRETRAYVPKLLAMRRIVTTRRRTAWSSRRSRISPTSPRSTWRRRSICTSRPSWRSWHRKSCSRSIRHSITGSPIPTVRTPCSCRSIANPASPKQSLHCRPKSACASCITT